MDLVLSRQFAIEDATIGMLTLHGLTGTLSTSPAHAPAALARWRADHNHVRPRSAHGGAAPAEVGMRGASAVEPPEAVAGTAVREPTIRPGL